MRYEVSVLVSEGDMRISWDPERSEEVEEARALVNDLRQRGFEFFLVDGGRADEVANPNGALDVRRIAVSELMPEQPQAAAQEPPTSGRKRGPYRRKTTPEETTQVVAVPQRRGG
jgi:hypothetical protein